MDFEFTHVHQQSKICNIYIQHFVLSFFFFFFFHENTWINCHPEYFGIYFSWWNYQMRFNMVHSKKKKMQNFKLVILKRVTYT